MSAAQDGCSNSGECAENAFCAKAVGDCDGVGECVPRPAGCIPTGELVCGCDGLTYDDVCAASFEGVSVAHDGACK